VGLQNGLVRAIMCALLVSGLAGAVLPVSAQQPANPEKNVQVAAISAEPGRASSTEPATERAKVDPLPDSPGTSVSKQQSAGFPGLMLAQNQSSQSQSPQSQSTQPQSSQTSSSSNQSNQDSASDAQKPVGTAAAEAPHATGVAASQPAGVAIAPTKQHRVRTIVIRVGAIVGAGVAVGTVVALTEGTSSKPPGAH
jgi:cell division protein FtsN